MSLCQAGSAEQNVKSTPTTRLGLLKKTNVKFLIVANATPDTLKSILDRAGTARPVHLYVDIKWEPCRTRAGVINRGVGISICSFAYGTTRRSRRYG
jgi:hypothetical protein